MFCTNILCVLCNIYIPVRTWCVFYTLLSLGRSYSDVLYTFLAKSLCGLQINLQMSLFRRPAKWCVPRCVLQRKKGKFWSFLFISRLPGKMLMCSARNILAKALSLMIPGKFERRRCENDQHSLGELWDVLQIFLASWQHGMSNYSFLAGVEQIICRTPPPLAASEKANAHYILQRAAMMLLSSFVVRRSPVSFALCLFGSC